MEREYAKGDSGGSVQYLYYISQFNLKIFKINETEIKLPIIEIQYRVAVVGSNSKFGEKTISFNVL